MYHVNCRSNKDVGTRIMVDSGASCSVCPKNWNCGAGLYQLAGIHIVKLKSATGDIVRIFVIVMFSSEMIFAVSNVAHPTSVSSCGPFAHSTTQAPNSLPTWTTGTCGSNRSTYCRQSLSSQQPPDQSTLLYSPPRHRCGEPLARTSFHLSSKTRSHSHSAAWVSIFKFMATSSPALMFWESRPPWRDLNAAGLNAQAVNDLLTMYVGAAS